MRDKKRDYKNVLQLIILIEPSRVYIMWTRLLSTAVIPVALLLYFNSRIFIDLLNSKVLNWGDMSDTVTRGKCILLVYQK